MTLFFQTDHLIRHLVPSLSYSKTVPVGRHRLLLARPPEVEVSDDRQEFED